ncbi:hypothetical protein DRW03_13935 [Corallococcus sp. H22C18031201]|uniref:hypothetical protein n=1 Tax=Citreicoccus inhibens TaxID=2849499 RepID=UPI000E73169C|nr:hypothetical protein [Citreicoccus inhibens]MBU8895557.1 hypothetical protein [Citreicoccus inhibens]RJS22419.1 hypothetical protein DRW03_13935 [Corallococcus sp. H22C18031201]
MVVSLAGLGAPRATRPFLSTLAALTTGALLSGCATPWTAAGEAVPAPSIRYRSASPPSLQRGRHLPPVGSEPEAPPAPPRATVNVAAPGATIAEAPAREEADLFEAVLLRAGFDATSELPPRAQALSPGDAAALYGALLSRPVTLGTFAPRRAVAHLLREVFEEGRDVSRTELLARMRRYEKLTVLRPDGNLAWVLTGAAQQRVGEVQWTAGAFRAYQFEVGPFYATESGAFRRVDANLRQGWDSAALAEVYGGATTAAPEQDAPVEPFVEHALALEAAFARPGDSLAALQRLPQGLADLLETSPAFLARFRLMTRAEQARAVRQLATQMLATCGGASGVDCLPAAPRPSWEARRIPDLKLSDAGALVLERLDAASSTASVLPPVTP